MTDVPTTTTPTDKIVLTAKGGKGYDDPWVVIHAGSVEEAAHHLVQFDPTVTEAVDARDLGLAIAQASVNLAAKVALSRGVNAQPVPVMIPPPVLSQSSPDVAMNPPHDTGLQAPPTATPTWSAAPQGALAPPQWIAPPSTAEAPGGYAPNSPTPEYNPEFNPPQPGPAPVGLSGFPYVWKFGVKDGRPWKAWMSGQPKANIDAGQAKDAVRWVR